MSKKRRPTPRAEWGQWELREGRAVLPPSIAAVMTPDDNRLFQNNIFAVIAELAPGPSGIPMLHLSFRRRDRKPIREWRHVQRMKSELCGADCEAVELYPNEDDLLDAANQYHLWVMPPGLRFPFGFRSGRNVADNADISRQFAEAGINWNSLPGAQTDWGPEGKDVAFRAPGILKQFFPEWAKFEISEVEK